MTKKIFAFILSAALILFTSSVFATDEIKGSMDKAGSSIKNVVDGAGNVVKDGAAAIGNGAKSVGNAVSNGAARTGDDMTRTDNNNGYTAARTATDGTILGMSANTWTWFVLAIAALAIVGLVWYYAMQNKNEYNQHND